MVTFNDVEAELRAVHAGLGIGQLPRYLTCEHLRSGALQIVLPSASTFRLGAFMYYPHRKRLLTRVLAFIDFAMEWNRIAKPFVNS